MADTRIIQLLAAVIFRHDYVVRVFRLRVSHEQPRSELPSGLHLHF